jgi:hypothetical protein
VPFSYYDRLTRAQQRIYRQSDGVTSLRLSDPPSLHPLVDRLAAALTGECAPPGVAGLGPRRPGRGDPDRLAVQTAAQALFGALAHAFQAPPCRLEVLAARPHGRWGELQGLYTTAERGRPAKVSLWMRTARQRRVVAFRTFLRTLLHELCHHLDYEHLRLADSFHTEGFYKRESSLFHQLVPEPTRVEAPSPPPST